MNRQYLVKSIKELRSVQPFHFIIYHFLTPLIRVLTYIPFIWKSEEWDHSNLTQLWAFSLKRHIKISLDDGHHIVPRNYRRRALACVAALNRISNDHDYVELYFEDLQKIPEWQVRIKTMELNRPPNKEITKVLKKMHEMEQYLYQQDIALISKWLKKDLRSLWD